MEYTCFEGITVPLLLDERSAAVNIGNGSQYSASTQLLAQSYNFRSPQFYNLPDFSWSTTDPTLLLTDHEQQQQRPEFLSNSGGNLRVSCAHDSSRDHEHMDIEATGCGPGSLTSFPTAAQKLFPSRSCSDDDDLHDHHHAGRVNNYSIAPIANLHHGGDMTTMSPAMSGRCNRRDNYTTSSSSSIDPFSFCGAVGSGSSSCVNAFASQSQWIHQMCSLSSDHFYSSGDGLLMPTLVSDPFADSPQQQQQDPCSLNYTVSSTSVNCGLHEADSCGSSDRDRSTTTSEETNWITTSCNSSDPVNSLPDLQGCVRDRDSVTGMIMSLPSPVLLELPGDELSSSIAAVGDDVKQLATTPTTLDNIQCHHRRGTCGVMATTAAAASAPSGRVSWMSPGVGNVRKNDLHIAPPTLDQLPLLGTHAAATSLNLNSNGLLPAPRPSLTGPFKPQHRPYTLDCSLPARTLPFPFSSSQNCSNSSMISPRYSSVYSVAPPVLNPSLQAENCTTSGRSSTFYSDFHSFSSGPQVQHGVTCAISSAPPAAGDRLGAQELSTAVGRGSFSESRKDFCSDQMALLSASRKPNVTSIEPQSVAARHRRKKISERVRILEKLIPGGNKMDTASMLDEAIDYVKFLQLQVQLLESMGEGPETLNHGAAEPGDRNTFAAAATTTTTTSASYPSHSGNCKGDGANVLIRSGFGSSVDHLSRPSSAALMQQVTIAAAAAATYTESSTSSPPLILSEVLQEQLFKQKLCLVSLRQYCPQGRRTSVGSIDWSETKKNRAM